MADEGETGGSRATRSVPSPAGSDPPDVWSIAGLSARQFVLGEAESTPEAGTDTLVDNLRRDGSERTYVLQRRVEAPRVLLDSVHAGVFR